MASQLGGPVNASTRLGLPALVGASLLACSAGGGAPPTADVPGAGGQGSTQPGTGGALIINPGSTPIEACASAAYQRNLLPSNLLFVVDRSGSMNCNLPPLTDSTTCEATASTADPSQPTKWSVIGAAMSSAFDTLATVPSTSVGLNLFSSDDACGAQSRPNVALAPLAVPQVSALKGALSGATPRGRTPFIGATVLAFKHLHEEAQAPGNRFVVLVTDGADSCLEEYAAAGVTGDIVSRLLDVEIPKALSVNIRTFVIGAPGSEPARGLLSKIAFAGGTARDATCDHGDAPAPGTECHLDMTRSMDFASDLSRALEGITGKAAMACEFDVPKSTDGAAVDPTSVNVDYYVGGNTTDASSKIALYRDDTLPCDAGASGWQYTADSTKIRLCGEICDQLRADPEPEVVVSVGCEQRVILK